MSATEIDSLISRLATMDREALLAHLRSLPTPFPLDFTDDYLNAQSAERLQHLIFAAMFQAARHRKTDAA